jgi:hypothetical protein
MTVLTKPSPAPWTLRDPEPGTNFDTFPWIAKGNGQAIATVNGRDPKDIANGRVMAAAPLLLASLKESLPWLRMHATEEARANRAGLALDGSPMSTRIPDRAVARERWARAVFAVATATKGTPL